MAERDRDSWLDDFSLVLTPDVIQRLGRDPDYEVYAGSKFRPLPWLVLVAAIAGAFGGTLVSAALWSAWWQVPLWLAAMVGFGILAARVTRKLFGPPITFLAGWCLFFGLVTGAFAMWGAQLDSAAWAYGVAGGLMFFLVGITGGLLEPPNAKRMEDWFLTSAIMAPIGGCLAVWIFRNVLAEPDTLASVALVGIIAALPFLTVTMALHLHAWRPARGMVRLAKLYLHDDEQAAKAIPLLDAALKDQPEDPALLNLRGLAHALAGNQEQAEADWSRHGELAPKSNASDIARGWLALRRGWLDEAAAAFERAMPAKKRDARALVGLGIARLRQGDAEAAVQALNSIPGRAHEALSLTYLAEAWLAYGDADKALGAATDAIEEADSIHGRSWLVRAAAYRALGKIESAAEDYNRAIWAADEPGIEDRARAGLAEIGRPVSDDEPEW